jgi:nicotinamidase/pyrazinamidase
MINHPQKYQTALIVVDLQNDFVDGGALAVPGGIEVVDVANRLIPAFRLVIATQDWHPADHLSFASQHPGLKIGTVFDLDGLSQVAWPDHCVQGTPGAAFVESLNCDGIHHVVRKGTDRVIDSYSGFFDNGHRRSTGLSEYLREQKIEQVAILGLATDYCVRFTALDAVKQGFRTMLIEDGCRGVELHPGDIARAMTEMKRAGVELVQSEEYLAAIGSAHA